MERKHTKQKSSNAFYIVLSLCLIAVGVAAWSAVSAFNDFKNTTPEPEPQLPQISAPETEKPTDSELPEVKYEKEEAVSEEKPVDTKPVADYFLLPIENGQISKNFDDKTLQYSKTFGDMRLHTGIDILCSSETPVKSAGKGIVTEVYYDSTHGNTIVIDHGNSIIAKYCGLNEDISVAVGDTVEAGLSLGVIGNIPGESLDESHLHFEMYKNGNPVSPLSIMGME